MPKIEDKFLKMGAKKRLAMQTVRKKYILDIWETIEIFPLVLLGVYDTHFIAPFFNFMPLFSAA